MGDHGAVRMGRPEQAPCPRRGLSSPSSGPHCRRPRLWAEAGWWSRRGRTPQAGGAKVGLGSTSLAVFSLLLAMTRTVYAKRGKSIYPVLLIGMGGAVICYLVAGLSQVAGVAMVACMFTGICTSMLWPGMLLYMEEKFPSPGIAAYALMAAGGDLGASVAPQGMGIVVDTVSASSWAVKLAEQTGLSAEQIGIKAGMLTAAVFPLIGIVVLLYLKRFFTKTA